MRYLLGFFVAGVFCSAAAYASPVISVSQLNGFPDEVLINHTATATYRVSNNTPVNFTGMTLENSPAAQVTGDGLCAAAPFALASGASCTLKLSYAASQTGEVAGGPKVCPDGSGVNCGIPVPSGRIDFTVVNALSDPATLSVSVPLLVIPGQTTVLPVTNTSSTVTANNVTLDASGALADAFDSVTGCDSIAPNSSCDISVATKASLSALPAPSTIVSGANTQAAAVILSFSAASLAANDVTLSAPNTPVNLTLTNEGAGTASVTNISFADSIYNVEVPSIPSSCESLGSGESCSIPIEGAANAYGSGNVTITYTGGASSTVISTLSVGNSAVSLNEGGDISLSADGTKLVSVQNDGSFAAQGLNFSISGIANATVVVAPSDPCGASLAAGASCNVAIQTSGALVSSGTATLSGDNLAETVTNNLLVDTPSVELDDSTANVHLQDRAIKLTNTDEASLALPSSLVTIPNDLSDKIIDCSVEGSSCQYTADACTPGGSLASGESCYVWLEARNPGNIDVSSTSDTLTIHPSIDPSDDRDVSLTYALRLYIAGQTILPGDSTTYEPRIISIDGVSTAGWQRFFASPSSSSYHMVRDMKTYRGDLYVGGRFSDFGVGVDGGKVAVNNILKWNGANISEVDGGVGSGGSQTDYALATFDGQLYAGGYFNQAGNVEVQSMAAFNGTTWSDVPAASDNNVGTVGIFYSYDGALYLSYLSGVVKVAGFDGSAFQDVTVVGGAYASVFSNNATDLLRANDDFIGYFDGENWAGYDIGSPDPANFYALDYFNVDGTGDRTIVAGDFSNIGSPASGINKLSYLDPTLGWQALPDQPDFEGIPTSIAHTANILYLSEDNNQGVENIWSYQYDADPKWSVIAQGVSAPDGGLLVVPQIDTISLG